jgi:hypothetical protein
MDQEPVIRFLLNPRNWPDGTASVEHVETHISHVFLGRMIALKMKKAVRLPYLDFSTLAARHRYCRRELEVNARFSPQLYLSLAAVVRAAEGLRLIEQAEPPPAVSDSGTGAACADGNGRKQRPEAEVVEWLVRMRRFRGEDILARRLREQPPDAALVRDLAAMAAAGHRAAEVRRVPSGRGILAATIRDQLRPSFAAARAALGDGGEQLLRRLEDLLHTHGRRLDARVAQGWIRRCHGDMHLGNIVLLEGRPVLFDAIEFSEAIATVDVLYDLAFLLMDLAHRGHAAAAAGVWNTWLALMDDERHHAMAGAMGLFVAMRAAIRAMVALDLAAQKQGHERAAQEEGARGFLSTALAASRRPRLRLIAVGGLSGTGKTTLARALAPLLAPPPGALHLRSDVERKRMFGRDELQRLPESCYTPEISRRVYDRLARRAALALESGWPVIVDAVYARAEERAAIARVAAQAGAEFTGLWLAAPPKVLRSRVAARRGDASDATPQVVERQLEWAEPPADWLRLDASGPPQDVLRQARAWLVEKAED